MWRAGLVLLAWAGCMADAAPRDPTPAPLPSPAPPSTSWPSTSPSTAPVVCADPFGIASLSVPGEGPLAPGDPVPLEHGPQGGWHVALEAEIVGVAARSVVAHAAVEVVETGEGLAGADNTFVLAVFGWDAATCAGTMRGMLAYLDDPPDIDQERICALADAATALSVRLTVEDLAHTVSDEVVVEAVAAADPDDPCGSR